MFNMQDRLRHLRLLMLAVADDMMKTGAAMQSEKYLKRAEELIADSDKVKGWEEDIENDQ